MVGYRSRITYWNCSKFADKLRKWFNLEVKPGAATEEEWDAWEERNSKKIGYWFVEEGLNLAQDIWLFIPDVYENIRTYITNRFIDKTHIIQTGFAPGGWYEYDDRILEGLFKMLKDFVENDKAEEFRWQDDSGFKTPNAEIGLRYLKWEAYEADNMPERKAAAKEIIDLYNWWCYARPMRVTGCEMSGFSAMVSKHGFRSVFRNQMSEEDEAEYSSLAKLSVDIDKRHYDEDTAMLIRLMKIRDYLVT